MNILATLVLTSLIFLSGCSSTSIQPGSAEHAKAVKADHNKLQKNDKYPNKLSLSIDEALNLAVRENLDAHVAALEHLSAQKEITLEQIQALPSLKYTLTRHGRSKESASSSLSVSTGQQSLEPSISQERYKVTRDITLNWNIIDAASALVRGRTAKDRASISEERYKKVIQNIHRDVYAAYWRAVDGKKTESETAKLIKETRKHIAKLDKAANQKLISRTQAAQQKEQYLSDIAALEVLQNEFSLVDIELKSLLNIPQKTTVILTSKPTENLGSIANLLQADIEELELSALYNRPEMREAFIEKNISIRDTKQEMIRTIPGGEVFFALNKDTNKFLSNQSWQSYTMSLVQNITNLLSFPSRYVASKQKESLAEAKRFTLAAALIAQVHIARHGLINAQKQYETTKAEKQSADHQIFAAQKRQHAGHMSKGDALSVKLQAHRKRLEYKRALAAFHESYATFLNTLGVKRGEPVPLTSMKEGVL